MPKISFEGNSVYYNRRGLNFYGSPTKVGTPNKSFRVFLKIILSESLLRNSLEFSLGDSKNWTLGLVNQS